MPCGLYAIYPEMADKAAYCLLECSINNAGILHFHSLLQLLVLAGVYAAIVVVHTMAFSTC